jgi:thioredoxin-related protein
LKAAKKLTFIVIMKKILLILNLVIVAACTQAQNKQDITNIPPFKILRTDSTWFTPADLVKNKPVMIIYFAPDCSHCQHLVYEMRPRMKQFGDIQIVMVTFTDPKMLIAVKNFYRDFDLKKYHNITVGTEGRTYVVQQYYQVATTPYIAIYDHKGKLVKAFDKVPPMDELVAAVKKS